MPKLNSPPCSLTHIKMATALQRREMDEKKSPREREPCRLGLPRLRPGSLSHHQLRAPSSGTESWPSLGVKGRQASAPHQKQRD